MPRRLLLLVTLLALTAFGSAQDAATEAVPVPAFSVLSNTTLTCSARLPSTVVGCFLERPVLVLGAFEVAVGIDAQATLRQPADGHVAAYIIAAVYLERSSFWVEVFTPEIMPPIGTPDWLRVGLSVRF